jgi:hypothetical protein
MPLARGYRETGAYGSQLFNLLGKELILRIDNQQRSIIRCIDASKRLSKHLDIVAMCAQLLEQGAIVCVYMIAIPIERLQLANVPRIASVYQ